MTLHTISTAIPSLIKSALISDLDVVLFWQNGVMLAQKNNPLLDEILAKTKNCYALESDIQARGVSNFIDKRIILVNMETAVKLTAKHSPQLNWGE